MVGAGVRRCADAALPLQSLRAQMVERAPADAVGGDRVGRDPFSVGVCVEVLAGGDGRIEFADVVDGRGRSGRLRGLQRRLSRGGTNERGGEGARLEHGWGYRVFLAGLYRKSVG